MHYVNNKLLKKQDITTVLVEWKSIFQLFNDTKNDKLANMQKMNWNGVALYSTGGKQDWEEQMKWNRLYPSIPNWIQQGSVCFRKSEENQAEQGK